MRHGLAHGQSARTAPSQVRLPASRSSPKGVKMDSGWNWSPTCSAFSSEIAIAMAPRRAWTVKLGGG